MKARLVKFGEIEVEGKRYTHHVVIDGGKVRKRKKGPSKQFREKFGHTPLSCFCHPDDDIVRKRFGSCAPKIGGKVMSIVPKRKLSTLVKPVHEMIDAVRRAHAKY